MRQYCRMRRDPAALPSPPVVAALRRAGAAAVVVAAAGGLHLWLLSGLPLGIGQGQAGGVPTLQVRQLTLVAAAAPLPERRAAVDEPAHRAPPRRPARPATRTAVPAMTAPAPRPDDVAPEAAMPEVPAPRPAEPADESVAKAALQDASPAALPGPPESEVVAAAPAVAVDAALVVDVATAGASSAGGGQLPTYATRMPPAARLQYDMRRGVLSGQGELVWQPAVDAYEMSIEGVAFGIPVLAWASRGAYDRAGLAPVRFLDRRRGRDLRAANFQRDKAIISYSSATLEVPLAPGAQDRLSWMVQLSAIVEAAGGRVAPGERFSMQVTGARGDADVWTFVAGAREDLELPIGRVARTVMFSRAPRKPHDTQVEVWLDPARHHLPVRMRLTSLPSGDSTEFLLRAAS